MSPLCCGTGIMLSNPDSLSSFKEGLGLRLCESISGSTTATFPNSVPSRDNLGTRQVYKRLSSPCSDETIAVEDLDSLHSELLAMQANTQGCVQRVATLSKYLL